MKNVDLDSLLTRILTNGLDVTLDGENILSIIHELQEARGKIKELENKKDNNSPVKKPWMENPDWFVPSEVPLPNIIIDKCKECNIDLYQVMGYCCPHTNCPCGLGPTMC